MRAHHNNIGPLRLLFASLVIFGHAPELIDGDRSREPLTVLFHTLSLGDLAVDAFFLLSGYLITKSYMRNGNLVVYLERRVLRIYPAFLVASVVSIFLLGALLGAAPWLSLGKTVARMALLYDPTIYVDVHTGHPLRSFNGSMWTIIYEFRCYLLIALLGQIGCLKRRWLIAALTLAGLAANIALTYPAMRAWSDHLAANKALFFTLGDPFQTVRLTAGFLVGANAWLFRDELAPLLRARITVPALAMCAALMFEPHLAEVALLLLGGLFLFWLALAADFGPLRHLNDRWDISYGVYLYGWPAALFVLWLLPAVGPIALAFASLALAVLAGAASWWGVEKWSKGRQILPRGVVRMFQTVPMPEEGRSPA
ncbi:MAG: acyltransferase family protein [Caulobacteraceae bacterium]